MDDILEKFKASEGFIGEDAQLFLEMGPAGMTLLTKLIAPSCPEDESEIGGRWSAILLLEEDILQEMQGIDATKRLRISALYFLLFELLMRDKLVEAENRRTGAAKIKQSGRTAAIALAMKIWEEHPSLRIGDVSEMVWAQMAAPEYISLRPETVRTLKVWIKPCAPESARKPGRPSKVN